MGGTDARSARNARTFFERYGVDEQELLDSLPPLRDDEAVLLVGSITDGLANSLSDIDLLVVGAQNEEDSFVLRETEFEQTLYRLRSGHEVNIEYWQASELNSLAERLAEMYAAIDQPEETSGVNVLSEAELRLVHRIRTGLVYGNPPVIEAWRKRFQCERFCDYLILYWLTFHYTLREDAIAQVAEGDQESALCMLRFAMDFFAGALLASVGESNPYPKWRPRLLKVHAGAIGEDKAEQLLDFLFPVRSGDGRLTTRNAVDYADRMLQEILSRNETIVPAVLNMGQRVQFVTELQ